MDFMSRHRANSPAQIAAPRSRAGTACRCPLSTIAVRFVFAFVAFALQSSGAIAAESTARWFRYGPADAPIAALWSDPRTGATAALAMPDGPNADYLRSNDGGRTWTTVHRFETSVDAGRSAFAASPGLEFVTNYPDINTDGPTMLSSNDAGRSWAPTRFPTPPPVPLRDLQSFNPDNPNEQVYQAMGEGGIAITHDGGVTWRVIPIGFGNQYETANTMVDWKHRILLAGAGESIFEMQALDAAASWTPVAEGSSTAAVRGGTILQVRNEGIHRSTDGGQTFELVFPHNPSNDFIRQFAFAPSPQSRVYALGVGLDYGEAVIYRSDDDGRKWTVSGRVPCDCEMQRLEADVLDADRLLLSTSDGVFESANAGATFAAMRATSGLPGAYAFRLVFESPTYRWRWILGLRPAAAADGAGAWSHGAAGGGVVGENIQLIDNGTVPGVLFGVSNASSVQRFYRSTNGSASWTLLYERMNYNRHAYPFLVAAADGKSLYLIGNNTTSLGFQVPLTLRSTDAGASWEGTGGYPRGLVTDIGATATPSFRLYAATSLGLHYSDDGAATWVPITSAPGGAVSAVGIDPRDARHVLAGYRDPDRVPLMRSDDAGATWTPSSAGLGGGPVTGIVFDRRDPLVVYAAQSGQGVFRSTDGGRTWRAIDAGMHAPRINRLQMDPGGRALYASTDRGLLALNLDDGIPAGSRRGVEYFHAGMNHYFVTADLDEIDALDAGVFSGWARTGQAIRVFEASDAVALPVCRYFALGYAPQSTHFYSPYAHECGILASMPDWTFEKYAFGWSLPRADGGCPEGTAPIHRLFNHMIGGAPNHRYTASMASLQQMLFEGWIFEGSAATRVFACVPE